MADKLFISHTYTQNYSIKNTHTWQIALTASVLFFGYGAGLKFGR